MLSTPWGFVPPFPQTLRIEAGVQACATDSNQIKMLTVAKLKDQMLDHARYAKYLQEQIEEREATRKCIDQLVCFAFWEMIEERGMLPSQVVGRLREDMAKSYHRAVMPVQFWNVDGLNAFLRRVSDQRV